MNRFIAVCLALFFAGAAFAQHAQPAPVAHWNFDEPEATTIPNMAGTTGWVARADRSLPRARGIEGHALQLRGTHALVVRPNFKTHEWPALSFAAWVKPTDLSGFREIFRQECDRRLLFSFQENGTILSLGLNIGGYVECDAAIESTKVLDGTWHHCAATFDGSFMRVYLDGREIGSLPRAGKISLDPDAAAYIGSLGGGGEHFQGALDEVRIYSVALGPEQVGALWQAGVEVQQKLLAELEKRLGTLYVPGRSFAETLATARRKFAEQGNAPEDDLSPLASARLKSAFPVESETFRNATGMSALEYMLSSDLSLNSRLSHRLLELVLEYRPLTEQQWQRKTPEEVAFWAEADRIKARLDNLSARGKEAEFASEWVELMLEAAARIQFRPYQNEPVAPYVPPATPQTRDLTAAEARQALERDWLHQAGQNPTPDRILQEIHWARELVERIQSAQSSEVDFAPELSGLDELKQQALRRTLPDRELYLKVREIKRRIMFRNPVVDFDKVVFVDMPFPQGSEWRHETRHRLGYMAVPGASTA